MSSPFILVTLFITLTLAWVARSAPAARNYFDHCPGASLSIKEFTNEFVYFPGDLGIGTAASTCNYCGGFYPVCCSNVCGVLGYKYYACLECQCACGN